MAEESGQEAVDCPRRRLRYGRGDDLADIGHDVLRRLAVQREVACCVMYDTVRNLFRAQRVARDGRKSSEISEWRVREWRLPPDEVSDVSKVV
jgi:hypothetical protein